MSKGRLQLLVLCLAALVVGASESGAVQVYSLYGEGCNQTSGAIVHVDDETISVLTLTGAITRVKIATVQLVARYDVLENPFPRIVQDPSGPAMLTVASESSEGTFRAYATDYFEDLVLFLDDAGKIRVVQMDEIVAITHDLTLKPGTGPALPFRSISLVSPPGRETCPSTKSAEQRDKSPVARVATLVMADKLRIDSFWSGMRKGYQDLESLRERTLFYARPIMFDQKTRLGITAVRTNRYELYKFNEFGWDSLPLYLEFGSGQSYRFQSSSSLGLKSWRFIPEVRPIAAWRSEFKSHLLHGMFLANLNGFTAGTPVYDLAWSPQADPDKLRGPVWMESSFNHLTLLGVDYGPWTLSYGYYFPTFALGQQDEFREFTSTKTSSIGHVGYQPSGLQVELFVFNTDMEGDGLDFDTIKSADELRRDSSFVGDTVKFHTLRNIPETAHITSTSARIDTTMTLPNDITAGWDVSFTNTRYRESAARFDIADDPSLPEGSTADPHATLILKERLTNEVARILWGTRAHVRMDLGQWVALRAEASFEQSKVEGGFDGTDKARRSIDKIHSYVVTMELLL